MGLSSSKYEESTIGLSSSKLKESVMDLSSLEYEESATDLSLSECKKSASQPWPIGGDNTKGILKLLAQNANTLYLSTSLVKPTFSQRGKNMERDPGAPHTRYELS